MKLKTNKYNIRLDKTVELNPEIGAATSVCRKPAALITVTFDGKIRLLYGASRVSFVFEPPSRVFDFRRLTRDPAESRAHRAAIDSWKRARTGCVSAAGRAYRQGGAGRGIRRGREPGPGAHVQLFARAPHSGRCVPTTMTTTIRRSTEHRGYDNVKGPTFDTVDTETPWCGRGASTSFRVHSFWTIRFVSPAVCAVRRHSRSYHDTAQRATDITVTSPKPFEVSPSADRERPQGWNQKGVLQGRKPPSLSVNIQRCNFIG